MSVSISLYELTKKHDLDAYVEQCVEADEVMIKSFQATIDKLTIDLQKNLPAELKPVRVVKGGSLCKGTSTIGSFDMDLVLMLPNYPDVRQLRGDMHKLLKQLKRCVEVLDNVTATERTDFGVHVEYTDSMGDIHDVDVMIAVDLITTEGGVKSVYDVMKTRDRGIRTYYYSSLVPLHYQVFKEIHSAKLKNLIRLVKYWKKERELVFRTVNRGDIYRRWPSSYVMEVLILVLWTRAASPNVFSLRKAMYTILKTVVKHRELVIIPENRFLNYDRKIAERSDCGPYIMDPCNPFNNLYLTPGQRTAWNWDDIEQEAQYFLERPAFQNVSGPLDRW